VIKDAKSAEELRREAEHYRKVVRYINDDQVLGEIAKLIEELERRAQEKQSKLPSPVVDLMSRQRAKTLKGWLGRLRCAGPQGAKRGSLSPLKMA